MTAYEHGFLSKCAEYGIDGYALLRKVADGSFRPAEPRDFRWYQLARYGLVDPTARVVDTPNGPRIFSRGKPGSVPRFDVSGNPYTPPPVSKPVAKPAPPKMA